MEIEHGAPHMAAFEPSRLGMVKAVDVAIELDVAEIEVELVEVIEEVKAVEVAKDVAEEDRVLVVVRTLALTDP
jgi:hypothetical protein